MSTFAVGDVQGCARTLDQLLDELGFRPGIDRLWLVGDVVNRGRYNVEVMERIMGLEATMVLGNHDLHLLARADGSRRPRDSDSLSDILDHPDRHRWLDWLRSRPLFHREGAWAMVHAGLRPQWTEADVRGISDRLSESLRGRRRLDAEATADLGILTTVRLLHEDGRPSRFKGTPESAPPGTMPWYTRHAGIPDATTVFGHWAALGHRRLGPFISLDSGAVWGRSLTALRLDDGVSFHVDTVPDDLRRF
jgi:bis(5'-nucleosyl)-tetraphosphatase (symmetrical)